MVYFFSLVTSKVAQVAAGTFGLVSRRWYRNPKNIVLDLVIFIAVFTKFEYIPISNRIHIDISFDKIEKFVRTSYGYKYNSSGDSLITETEAETRVDPQDFRVTGVLQPIVINIIQALSDGLRFQQDCKVSICNTGGDGSLVPSRYRKFGLNVSSFIERLFRPKYKTDHLDGLNWKVTVVESSQKNACYSPDGNIQIELGLLDSATDAELTFTIGHEVGHGVALHLSPNAFMDGCWLLDLIGCPVMQCVRALVKYLLGNLDPDRLMSKELEADYIGLMLMASAGYDPRKALKCFHMKGVLYTDCNLSTTHPPADVRSWRLSQPKAMDKALKIYEQVQAGLGVPSFV